MILTGEFQDLSIWPVTLGLTVWLLAIGWIDARSLRIPDILSLPLIGFGLLWTILQPERDIWSHLIGAGLGYAVLAAIGWAYFLRNQSEGLGLGDAKLFAAAGAWLGWRALPEVLLIAAVAGLIFALVRKAIASSPSAQVAFGPWLALGMWVVWMWQTVRPTG